MIMGFFIAILAGVFASDFSEYFDFISYLLFISITMIGSILPNLVEPRHGENHRKFFHSFTVLGTLVILLLWLNSGDQSLITYLSSGFVIGYNSHLLFDVTSKQRLPIY